MKQEVELISYLRNHIGIIWVAVIDKLGSYWVLASEILNDKRAKNSFINVTLIPNRDESYSIIRVIPNY